MGFGGADTVLTATKTLLNDRRGWNGHRGGSGGVVGDASLRWVNEARPSWSLTSTVLWNRSSRPSGRSLLKSCPSLRGSVGLSGSTGKSGSAAGRRPAV